MGAFFFEKIELLQTIGYSADTRCRFQERVGPGTPVVVHFKCNFREIDLKPDFSRILGEFKFAGLSFTMKGFSIEPQKTIQTLEFSNETKEHLQGLSPTRQENLIHKALEDLHKTLSHIFPAP